MKGAAPLYVNGSPLRLGVRGYAMNVVCTHFSRKRCATPGHMHDFSPLSGNAWACVNRWGLFSRGDMYDLLKSHLAEKRRKATCRRSDGRMKEDVLERKS